jgi:hypothetical protein
MKKIDLKNKCINEYTHDHIYLYRENMFVIVELFEGTRGRQHRKKE